MKKKRILIIDDFAPLLEEVSDFLTFEGFKTYTAKNGVEGVQMVIQHSPDLIICDIEMPKMGGYEVLKTIEKIPSYSAPFIFLTARAQVEDFKAGLKLGADDYITKPLEMDNLLFCVKKRLEKHEHLKNTHKKEFESLLHNPFIGIFIFKEDHFFLINEKLQEITGYSKQVLNNISLSKIIINDPELILAKLKSVLNKIHDSVQLKISFINKTKKAVFIDVFAKHIEIGNRSSLIGTVKQINNASENTKTYNIENNEFRKIVDFLLSTGKEKIAEEILNIKNILTFDEETNRNKIKEKVKLTKRELEVLQLICDGFTNVKIAEKLFISNRTVDNHRANLLLKTSTGNTASLVAFAIKNNFVK
ncbi:MAG: response regulator [Bacteroidales bacterium]|nr:response regulator [Bacteroidales bacterium]